MILSLFLDYFVMMDFFFGIQLFSVFFITFSSIENAFSQYSFACCQVLLHTKNEKLETFFRKKLERNNFKFTTNFKVYNHSFYCDFI